MLAISVDQVAGARGMLRSAQRNGRRALSMTVLQVAGYPLRCGRPTGNESGSRHSPSSVIGHIFSSRHSRCGRKFRDRLDC